MCLCQDQRIATTGDLFMMNFIQENHEAHNALITKVAQQYEKDGYKVYIEPESFQLPFDLNSYRPDVLAIKSATEGYIIEVKTRTAHVAMDRFCQLAETIAQHPGWRFLLVTGDDISQNGLPNQSNLLSWQEISTMQETAEKGISLAEIRGERQQFVRFLFLEFWTLFEAMMRKQAEHVAIPIEYFPTSSLIKNLYSQGEISVEQFDSAMILLNIRNQVVHGFQAHNLETATSELQKLVSELSELWVAPNLSLNC